MNINKIFNLFDNKDEEDDTTLLIDFSDHPLFWIGGFNKILNHYDYFNKYLVKSLKESYDNIGAKDLEKISKQIMYKKAWEFIKLMNLENPLHITSINSKSTLQFKNNLDETISYFEQNEEFEKCALLFKIKKVVLENLNLD